MYMGRSCTVFDVPLGFALMTTVEEWEYPSFAKEGWTRPKENAAKHPLWSGRGGCFKLPLIHSQPVRIIGGLKQPPLLREGGVFACPDRFPNLESSAPVGR